MSENSEIVKDKNKSQIFSDVKNKNVNGLIQGILNSPIAHVDRTEYLSNMFNVSQKEIIDGKNDFSLSQRKSAANRQISSTVNQTSAISFASGIPGGMFMLGTIPEDIIQNMTYSIRLAQQLAFIYGNKDILDVDGNVNIDKLLMYFGVMFGVNGSSALLRVTSSNIAKNTSKMVLNKALTKTAWYPVLKNISKVVGSKVLTKNALSKGVSKAVPIIGGIISGGVTMFGTKSVAKNLNSELIKEFKNDYSEEEYRKDIHAIEKISY